MKRFLSVSVAFVVGAIACVALSQNPDYPGYIGVYVIEGNGGMEITGFIPNTPAAEFAAMGEMRRGDIINRIGRYSTRTLQELRYARNSIPQDMEGKMVLFDQQGYRRHLWISRNEGQAAAAAPAAPGTRAAPANGAPDRFNKGGRGEGSEGEDYRRRTGASSTPAPGGGNGDYRPRQ